MSEPDQQSPKFDSDHPKIFDVMRPGKAPASPTSRPVIMGHKSIAQDSTLTDKSSPLDAPAHNRPLMDSAEKVAIEPPASDSPALPAEPEPAGETPPHDFSAPPEAETHAEPEPEQQSAPAVEHEAEPFEQAVPPEVSPNEPTDQPAPPGDSKPSLPLDAIKDQPTMYMQPPHDETNPVQATISHHLVLWPRSRKILLLACTLTLIGAICVVLILVETKIR